MGFKLNPFTGTLDVVGSSGSSAYARSATLVVAASDSLDTTNVDYLCDGTADEVQIEAAVAALPSGGGRIVLMEGLFTIGAAVDLTKSSVTVEGQGTATIIKLADATNVNCINVGAGVTAYNHIKIKNLKVDGNVANQTTGGHGVNINTGASYTEIDNCWIVDCYTANIYDAGGDQTYIHDNHLDNSNNSYANIEGVGDNARIIGNHLNDGVYANISIYNGAGGLGATNGCVVANNVCTNSGGFGIENANWATDITGNFITTFASNGIKSTLPANISANSIIVDSNPSAACIFVDSSDPQTVTGNHILVVSGNSAAVVGVQVDASGMVVSGNTIQFETNQAHIGIKVTSGDYQTISGNNIVEYDGTVGSFGIQFTTARLHVTITGNILYQFETGIGFNGGSLESASIAGNSFLCRYGLILTDCTSVSVTGNSFYDYGAGEAIKAVNTARKDQISIVGNTFEAYNNDVISLQGVGYSTVANNVMGCTGTNAIFLTSAGVAYSIYNSITGNVIEGACTNGIKENSVNDGPSVIIGNIVPSATNKIVSAHVSTDVSHNITA